MAPTQRVVPPHAAVAIVLAGASWTNGCSMLIGVDPGEPEESDDAAVALLDGSSSADAHDDVTMEAMPVAVHDVGARGDESATPDDARAALEASSEASSASGVHAADDASVGERADAGTDARLDADVEAEIEAGVDARPETGIDASHDADVQADAGAMPPPSMPPVSMPPSMPPHRQRGEAGDSSQGVLP